MDPAPASNIRLAAAKPAILIAWIVILAVVAFETVIANWPELLESPSSSTTAVGDEGEAATDDVAFLGVDAITEGTLRLQARVAIGGSIVDPATAGAFIAPTREAIDTGPVAQRQRWIPVSAELGGPLAAADDLADLADLIETEGVQLNDREQAVQDVLLRLYPGADAATADDVEGDIDPDAALVERVAALPGDQRTVLTENLGWFGELALLPSGTADEAGREKLELRCVAVVGTITVGGMGAVVALIGGAVGLIIICILVGTGKVKTWFPAPRSWHSVYAEAFAIWIVLFFLLAMVAGMVAGSLDIEDSGLFLTSIAFFMSLLAIAWPVVRGVPFQQVRHDIGWTAERGVLRELGCGLMGYCMALPLLAIGIVLTLVLMLVQAALSAEQGAFDSAAAPSHPIVEDVVLGASLWTRIQILLLASIAAPVVEETMFRGALYRMLRSGSAGLGAFMSIALSTLVASLIFAMIHPQGWVAIPALASLAVAFTLVREWRGSLVAPMVMHGVSNGLVMSFVMLVF
jgi:membrane protease YdiL (CAAX protease family)